MGKAPESDFWERMRRDLSLWGTDEELRSYILKRFIPRQWMFSLITQLIQDRVCTGILSDQVDWLERLNKDYNFYSVFDKVFNSFDLGMTKRDAGTFSYICQVLDVLPQEVLFLDDSESNIQRARETGMQCIQYTDRESLLNEFLRIYPRISPLKKKENLQLALQTQFSQEDSHYLNQLLFPCLDRENIVYQEIPIPDELKNEYILMAFEERLLIPVQAKQESCWEERGLKVCSGEMYFMPRLSKNILQLASITGHFEPEPAIRELLQECDQKNIPALIQFIQQLKSCVQSYKIEAPNLLKVAQEFGIVGEELLALADLFVILSKTRFLGILSPSPSGTLAQGMAKFEINPCLYW